MKLRILSSDAVTVVLAMWLASATVVTARGAFGGARQAPAAQPGFEIVSVKPTMSGPGSLRVRSQILVIDHVERPTEN